MKWSLTLALLCLAGPAAAADALPQVPASLLPLLSRPDHMAALLQAAHMVDPPGTTACPTANVATTGEVAVLAPIQSDSKGQPVNGAIKESMRETGCGRDRTLNALTIIDPSGALHTQPLLPGNTIADPQLQEDSVPFAAGAMGEMPAGCDQGAVTNTRFLGLQGLPPGQLPPPDSAPRPWTELWTLQACGKKADVTMTFTPDQTGTEIRGALAAP